MSQQQSPVGRAEGELRERITSIESGIEDMNWVEETVRHFDSIGTGSIDEVSIEGLGTSIALHTLRVECRISVPINEMSSDTTRDKFQRILRNADGHELEFTDEYLLKAQMTFELELN
ncbi:hypothetical protein [Halosegnis longus]|uniref:hypothetical protein n=1 Tax=Halosegnis longus TaxID=2216012 RepID=UPI00129E10B8|nr:hypothetical protein [Halosegnis longus]